MGIDSITIEQSKQELKTMAIRIKSEKTHTKEMEHKWER
jgi:hypothetical protein